MEICQTSNCGNSSIAICLHCQEYLCVEHLLKHNEELIYQANIYCDEFNQLTEQIENMSFDEQFTSAEDDLNDWINDQMKQLDKIYEEKLSELKQAQVDVKKKLVNFKHTQQMKITDIHRRLFNAQLSKQISLGQLNQMKTTVEKLREDIHQFKTNQCSINLVNNDKMNYSYKPNIDIQFTKKNSNDNDVNQEFNDSKISQLRADAKPFEYIPKDSTQQNDVYGRIFDRYELVGSINKTII